MFTPGRLLEIAAQADAAFKAQLALFPEGTWDTARMEAWNTREQALTCAAWMVAKGLTELANVGPFMSRTFEYKQRVRVRKGAPFFTTAPGAEKNQRTTRARNVTVRFFDRGYIDTSRGESDGGPVIQAKITWAGSGGYWYWADANDIEDNA